MSALHFVLVTLHGCLQVVLSEAIRIGDTKCNTYTIFGVVFSTR